MNIINVSPLWFHKGDGITDVVINLHEAFKKQGVSRKIIQTNVLKSKTKPVSNKDLYDKIDSDIYKPESKLDILTTIWKERKSRFIIHGVFQVEILMVIALLLIFRSNFLIVPHSSLSKNAFRSMFNLKSVFYHILIKYFIYFAKGIVYLNHNEKKSSIYKGENFHIISNGVNLPVNNEHLEHLIRREKLKFCFLGRYDVQHKGIDRLLNFLSQLLSTKPSLKWHLDIYGSDIKGDRKKVENLILKLGLASHVSTHGPVYGDDKANILKSIDIFTLTSRYEGMPIAVLEALAFGKFCFLSKETNLLSELQERGFCAEYNPDDFELSYKSLSIYLDKDEEQRVKIARMSVEYVKNEYSWNNVSLQYIKKLRGKE